MSGTGVWVIAKSHLRRFWEARKDDSEIAPRDLLTWFKMAESADWAHFAALKQTLGSAVPVGNCVVFDVGNNRFRLIGRGGKRRSERIDPEAAVLCIVAFIRSVPFSPLAGEILRVVGRVEDTDRIRNLTMPDGAGRVGD